MGTGAKKVWVVVANASAARLFRGGEDARSLVEFETLAHPAARLAGREVASDSSGVAFKTGGAGWHSTGTEAQLKQRELQTFAGEIARRLDEGRLQGEVAKLALIGSPALLGELRGRLSTQVGALVAFTLDKNLVHAAAPELLSALPDYFLARA